MSENEDYQLTKFRQQSETSRGVKYKNIYMLTPECFKTILIGANKHKTHAIEVIKYRKYYLFLETVVGYYMEYQLNLEQALSLAKDDTIDRLQYLLEKNEIKAQERFETMLNRNDNLMTEMARLHEKIDIIFEFMLSFARMTIPMWIGSSVIKTQFDNLVKSNSESYGLSHLKVMFVVSFFERYDTTRKITKGDKTLNVRSKIKNYFCCTNFGDVGARIKTLSKRHEEDMYMLKPQAICLISCEINTERTILERMNIFPEDTFVECSSKHKSFDVETTTRSPIKIETIYEKIVSNSRLERFQSYQMRIDAYRGTEKCPVNENIIQHITKADDAFFSSTLPFCQRFIDCYVKESLDEDNKFIEWTYSKATKTKKVRPDLSNCSLSERTYNLQKIQALLKEHNGEDKVVEMVKTGVISKQDIDSLKAIAKIEKIDISEVEFPDDSDDEE